MELAFHDLILFERLIGGYTDEDLSRPLIRSALEPLLVLRNTMGGLDRQARL